MASTPLTADEYLARAIQQEAQAKEIAFRDPLGARGLRQLAEANFESALAIERGNEHIVAA